MPAEKNQTGFKVMTPNMENKNGQTLTQNTLKFGLI